MQAGQSMRKNSAPFRIFKRSGNISEWLLFALAASTRPGGEAAVARILNFSILVRRNLVRLICAPLVPQSR